MTQSTDATTLRDLSELLSQISSATGLTQKQLETQFDDVHVTVYRYGNRNLVPPADFDGIIDTWANSIKTQIRSPGRIAASPKKKVAKAKTTRQKSSATKARSTNSARKAAPDKAKSKKVSASGTKTALPLPDNYKSVVSHLYGPSLKRIMPEEQAQQRSFLEAIAQESPDGVSLLQELSVIIADKYTGKMAPEAAYKGLKNKAQVLVDELFGPRKRKPVKKGKKAATRSTRKKKQK